MSHVTDTTWLGSCEHDKPGLDKMSTDKGMLISPDSIMSILIYVNIDNSIQMDSALKHHKIRKGATWPFNTCLHYDHKIYFLNYIFVTNMYISLLLICWFV